MADFPILDIADIDKPDTQRHIAHQITDACRSWGFLLLKNHPIPPEDIENMFALSRKFFHSEAEKSPWPISDKYIGYRGALDGTNSDLSAMWLSGSLAENLDDLPPYWRDHIAQVEHFKHSCHNVVLKLLDCFSLALDPPDKDFFRRAHAEGKGNGFVLNYYPARQDTQPLDTSVRLTPHTDSGSVTLLFQSCAGLELESPTGEWVPAPSLPGHVLVNLGDALAFWSGAHLRATKHRCTFDSIPQEKERFTMAYFGRASGETILEPIVPGGDMSKLTNYIGAEGEGRPPIKPGITVREYTQLVMEAIYGTKEKP